MQACWLTWFFIISVSMSVCVHACVCVSTPRLLITNGMIWTSYIYMATVVGITDGHGLGIDTHCRN